MVLTIMQACTVDVVTAPLVCSIGEKLATVLHSFVLHTITWSNMNI